jgi:predicted GNAT family acetyltransferase
MSTMQPRIENRAEQSRFELSIGTEVASFSEYHDADGTRTFFHTVTSPAYRGRGLAAVLTEFALDDARAKGLTVVPSCWFVHEFIETNRDRYGDLLSGGGSPS